MSSVTDIQVENFRVSIKKAEKSIYYAFLVAGVVHYLGAFKDEKNLPGIPFLQVQFTSVEALQVVLLFIYTALGVVAAVSAFHALHILHIFEDKKDSRATAHYPCIFVSSRWFSVILAMVLPGIGYTLSVSVFTPSAFYDWILLGLPSIPYFAVLRIGNSIYDWRQASSYKAES